MQKIYTTIIILFTIIPQLLAKSYTTKLDSLVKIKPDSIIRAERDSVLAPPIGFDQRKAKTNGFTGGFSSLVSIATPILLSPTSNNSVVYGSTVSLYWNKNNNVNACDYYVKVVDLTTLTILYNYTPLGDVASFEARNLVEGRTYAWLIRAVNRTNTSEVVETVFSNFTINNTNAPTLSVTSISGTNFCGSNRQITINYSRTGSFNSGNINYNNYYNYGNTFVELSNKNGDFINPILISATYLSSNSGSISISLPDNLPYGQNYKIRLFSYGPIVTSNVSTAMTIGTISNPSIYNRFDSSVLYNSIGLCAGSTATVKTNITDSTDVVFQWKKDGINITSGGNYSKYTISASGTYTVAITQGNCPTVTSASGPQAYSISGGNSTNLWRDGNIIQCTGGESRLTMPHWSDNPTYKWFKNGILISGETQRIYTATQTGTYSVNATDGNCITSATSDPLTFGSAISISSTFGASTICSTGGQTYSYANPAYSPNLATIYQWKRNGTNISGANSNYLTITQAGVYNAEVTQGGCVATSQGFEVKASTTLDSIKIIQDYSNYCNPSYIYLSTNISLQNATYRWKNTGITVNTNSSHNAIEDGNYTVTVTQGTCSTTSKPSAVSLNTNREMFLFLSTNSSPIPRDTIYICPDASQNIYVNNYPSGTYQWYKNNVAISGATSSSFSASQRGSYTFKVTAGSCILISKPIFVENTLPKFSLNATPKSNNLCSNNIFTLDYYDKGLYPYYCSRWKKDGVTFNTCASQVNVLESGIYTATVQQGSCVVESEALKISIGESVKASLSGSGIISSGGTAKIYVSFTGASPWTFTLSDGTSITTAQNPYTLTVNPMTTTTYTLSSVIGACGTGTVSGSAMVSVGSCSTPTSIFTQPLNQIKCTGSSVSFSVTATGGGTLTYQWKKDGVNISGANSSTLTINNIKSTNLGNYNVEVTGSCGMILSEIATLKVTNEVPFFIYTPAISVATGSNILLQTYTYTSIPVATFAWQGPNGYTSNLQNPTLTNVTTNNSGTYTISASNTQGCVGQAVASITVLTPTITINSLSATTFCSGQTGSISFSVPSGASTTYAVQLSNSDGTFDYYPNTLGTGTGSPINFILPSYSSGTSYNYKLRIVDTQNTNQISSPSAVIYFNTLTASVKNIIGDNNSSYMYLCQGSSVKLYARLNTTSSSNTTYEWQKDGSIISGATSATYTTNQFGQYKVKITSPGCGNATSDILTLSLTNYSGGFFGGSDSYQCAGISLELKANYNSESTSYIWKRDGITLSNQTTPSLVVTQSGTYSLESIDPNCYSNYPSSQKYTFGNVIPTALYSNDTVTICPNYGAYISTYNNSSNNYTYQWKKDGNDISNAGNSYYYASTPGIYSLQVTQGNCKAISRGILVQSGGTPSNVIKAYGGTNICTGTTPSYLFIDGLICASYQWQKNQVDIASQANNTSYFPSESGNYRVKITNGSTVSYSNTITITAGSSPNYVITIGSDTVSCIPTGRYSLNYYNLPSNTSFQWYRNSSAISGATSSGYSINDNGLYKLKVTIGNCVGYSQEVNFTTRNYLTKPILISNQGKIVCNSTYTFLNTKYTTTNYDYVEWKKNGIVISNTYNSYNFIITESGNYTLRIVQGNCSVESDPIKINLGDKQQSIKTADWNNATTWSCGTIPTVSEDIIINKTHIVSLPNNITGFLKNLELNGSIIQGSNAKLKFVTN
jgi:hypothetical protein